jgi:hypothetical protein
MELRVCVECRRHVAVSETACPFCGTSGVSEAPASARLGRLSRAAVFAGAALATTACGGKKPKAENIENTQQQTTSTADAAVEPTTVAPPDDRSNIPMPYGAPPARRRVV